MAEGAAWLLSVTGFAVAMTASPGPNTLMVTASGATFGVRRTLPHVLGIAVGFPILLVLVALGLGEVLRAWPTLTVTLRWLGAAWLLWLAWRIASALPRAATEPGRAARPLGFVGAALFQWVNPKAWLIAAGGVATYAGGSAGRLLWLATIFAAVTLASCVAWTMLGAGAGQLLRTPQALRTFNVAMALLLVPRRCRCWPGRGSKAGGTRPVAPDLDPSFGADRVTGAQLASTGHQPVSGSGLNRRR